jgi:hypothetical protein
MYTDDMRKSRLVFVSCVLPLRFLRLLMYPLTTNQKEVFLQQKALVGRKACVVGKC